MNAGNKGSVRAQVECLYRTESRRVLATLIRLLGDFDLAEEALHDAFAAAVEQWGRNGVPENPRAWLVSAGRFKAIDRIRRRARFDRQQAALANYLYETATEDTSDDAAEPEDGLADDRLRLIFICCHPALPADAQVALTLREICDLTTEEIAHAFLTSATTVAQRIVRAKAKIRIAQIPFEVPARADLAERLESVLRVLYLIFNEGYFASSGNALTRTDLSGEAIRLGRLLVELMPEPEVTGLLALMLITEARRPARLTPGGEPVLLDAQDRALWDRNLIIEGELLVQSALRSGRFGAYTLQAAIAAVHAQALTAADTDWNEIVGLYTVLEGATGSSVVALNRAVAVAMRDGPDAGLALIDALLARGELLAYSLAHSARADMYRRLNRLGEAQSAFEQALALTHSGPEQQFLRRRLQEISEARGESSGISQGPVAR